MKDNSVSFIHCADLHFTNNHKYGRINPVTNLNHRFEQQIDNFDFMCKYALKSNISFVVVSGDVYDVPNPPSREKMVVTSTITKWASAGLKFYILEGNHDSNGLWSALGDFDICNLDNNIFIFREDMAHNGNKVFVPWNCHNLPKYEMEKFGPGFLSAHVSVQGGDFGHGHTSQEGHSIQSLFNLGYQYIALGHFHKFQMWQDNDQIIAYSGSILAKDFREFNCQDKKFLVVNLDGKKYNVDVKDFPSRGKLLKVFLDEENENIEKVDDGKEEKRIEEVDLSGAVVKLLYSQKSKNLFKFSKWKSTLYDKNCSFVFSESLLDSSEKGRVEINIDLISLKTEELISEWCRVSNYDTNLILDYYKEILNNMREEIK